MMRRIEALEVLADITEDHPVVVTCAATSRELAHLKTGDNHLYLLDSMGLVGSVVTGLALALQDSGRTVVGIEGDGSLLMNPNVLFTNAALAQPNLVMVLLDNGVFGSTGNLPTYAEHVDFLVVAESLGHDVRRAADAEGIRVAFAELVQSERPGFLYIPIEVGNATVDKLLVDPVAIGTRFASWIERTAPAQRQTA